jgi:hypothetical protein
MLYEIALSPLRTWWFPRAIKPCSFGNIRKKHRGFTTRLVIGFSSYNEHLQLWYLYNLECYRTSCNNYNIHLMLYTISYIRCNSHATICNFFAINLHVRFPHTFQCGEQNANFHPFVDK